MNQFPSASSSYPLDPSSSTTTALGIKRSGTVILTMSQQQQQHTYPPMEYETMMNSPCCKRMRTLHHSSYLSTIVTPPQVQQQQQVLEQSNGIRTPTLMSFNESWSSPKRKNEVKTTTTAQTTTTTTTTTTMIEWWKKKQPIVNRRIPNDTDVCTNCQRFIPLTTNTDQSSTTTTTATTSSNCCRGSNMRDTSLLTYFQLPSNKSMEMMDTTCTTMSWKTKQDNNKTAATATSSQCTFCEKIVCQDCIASCETCQYMFCKFCRTIDYDSDGFMDHILCLDCHSNNKRFIMMTHENDDCCMQY